MTFERIADGLQIVMERLANDAHDLNVGRPLTLDGHLDRSLREPPAGWESWEWAYVLGLASGAVLRLLHTIRVPKDFS